MKIGMVGCGKLGLMVALTIESRGHEVKGYDPNREIARYLSEKQIPFQEEHADELLQSTKMEMVPLAELCAWADILFLAPQTPHNPKYEGTMRLPEERVDFDYSFLKKCVRDVCANLHSEKTCVIISTVLPGTLDREIIPTLSPCFDLVYEPLFIAMGTVYSDFLNPEFVLVGVDKPGPAEELESFYKTIHGKPVFKTDIRTAEGIKVFYNTFITMKTVLANMYGEMSHKLGMNVDDIYRAVCLATDRLISPKYLKAGMGDGGGCHPRDNIALSFIARKIGLSFDLFDALMTARERHCDWQADLIIDEHKRTGYPVYIMGMAFKPETNITTGSPSLLLSNILQERGIQHFISDYPATIERAIYFIGTQHEGFKNVVFPKGSIVIDPFRYLPQQEGVKYIRIGSPSDKPKEFASVELTDCYASRQA